MIPLAPFQIPGTGSQVTKEDWDAASEAWKFILRSYLALSVEDFRKEIDRSEDVIPFLVSYVQETRPNGHKSQQHAIDPALSRYCFALIHRLWSMSSSPPALLNPSFLKGFAVVFGAEKNAITLMDKIWISKSLGTSPPILEDTKSMQQSLEHPSSKNKDRLVSSLWEARALVRACHEYGRFLMTGADFLDALVVAWKAAETNLGKSITSLTFAALTSLTQGDDPRLSTLLDHLYTLRMEHEKSSSGSSLLHDLVNSTAFMMRYQQITTTTSSGRVADMLLYLEKIERRSASAKLAYKGKEAALQVGRNTDLEQSAAISQVHELFPELGIGYIARLADEYKQNGEEIVARLLDNSLPAQLQALDRAETIESYRGGVSATRAKDGTDEVSRSVFDDDDLGRLQVSAKRLHIGKKPEEDAFAKPFDKHATLAALAALDSDDDERDDTYDIEDVGGMIDIQNPEHDQRDSNLALGGGALTEATEAALFHAWRQNATLFSRDPAMRKSPLRADLRGKSGWSDEQVEGWAIMLQREPKRVKRLYDKFSDDQRFPTARDSDGDASEGSIGPSSDLPNINGASERGRGGHARGGRGRGRGGSHAHPREATHDPPQQGSRPRRDTNKSTRGHHNRRALRAKKLAQGM